MNLGDGYTDAQMASFYERAMVIAQRSEADRLESIKKLMQENYELRMNVAKMVSPTKAQELMLQITRLMQERDKWKAEAQEMEGRIANALL